MKWSIVVLIGAMVLAGCAAMIPDDRMRTMDTVDLCRMYYSFREERIKQELIRREAFSAHEWAMIDQKKIRIGICENALVCSWGPPTRINSSVGRWGVHKQYVYGRQYVYVKNGQVTSWQN